MSGAEVIENLSEFGFTVHSQKGSHVKLRRLGSAGNETLTVPNHKQLDTGTCKAIYRQAARFISEEQLFPYFYE